MGPLCPFPLHLDPSLFVKVFFGVFVGASGEAVDDGGDRS
jgi:hypothetical protein